uniref:Uncharacterized protein n=1 Tax=Romanomermis culicivorax TaxID=13658 RepID=A0A915KSG7_ROMCU
MQVTGPTCIGKTMGDAKNNNKNIIKKDVGESSDLLNAALPNNVQLSTVPYFALPCGFFGLSYALYGLICIILYNRHVRLKNRNTVHLVGFKLFALFLLLLITNLVMFGFLSHFSSSNFRYFLLSVDKIDCDRSPSYCRYLVNSAWLSILTLFAAVLQVYWYKKKINIRSHK